MLRTGYLLALLLLVGSVHPSSSAQLANDGSESGLELITLGQETMVGGRRGAFRIYAASDGTRAEVSYVHFNTLQDAKRQTKQWLQLADAVKRKNANKSDNGGVRGTRFLATKGKSGSKDREFLIIRRDDTMCYFIRSSTLPTALKVELLIAQK
jgi:hypothetical protein